MQIKTTGIPEEQLYLVIVTIVDYLRSRPEILVALDWIKTRGLDFGKEVSDRLYRIIGSIKIEAIRNSDRGLLVWVARWILFMIVNTLALWPDESFVDGNPATKSKDWTKNVEEIPSESFRILFRFIALGLEGLKN